MAAVTWVRLPVAGGAAADAADVALLSGPSEARAQRAGPADAPIDLASSSKRVFAASP